MFLILTEWRHSTDICQWEGTYTHCRAASDPRSWSEYTGHSKYPVVLLLLLHHEVSSLIISLIYQQSRRTALTAATPSLCIHMTQFIARHWHSTPIHKACYENDLNSLRALLGSISEASALSVCDAFGWTPLHVSVYMNRVEAVRLLLSKGANIRTATDRGHTALHLACYRGNVDMVRLLICSSVAALLSEGYWPQNVSAYSGKRRGTTQ